MQIIKTTTALQTLCAQLAEKPYITVDTEFIRETTFWPKLCLVQVAAEGVEAIIDPLATDIALAAFYEVLRNPNVVKVMHGCRQDIEIFHHEAEIIPAPLFDTQVAAMVCGFGDAVGYEALVRHTTGGKIDKGSRFTDWSARPLSDEQLTYALGDVTHLRGAYEHLRDRLETENRAAWIAEEMAVLRDPEIYAQRPENAWRRMKMHDARPRVLATLMELAEWREREAQTRNVPRGRVIKDDPLRELALRAPKDKAALSNMRGIPRGFAKSRFAKDVLAAIERGKLRDIDSLPPQRQPIQNRPGIGPLVELLRVLLKQCCTEAEVAPKLLASSADLERIASDDNPDVPALKGWRAEVFGKHAIALKEGRLALACENDRVLLVER